MDIAIMIEGQNGLTWPRWQNGLCGGRLGFPVVQVDHLS
jgi:hypothetical protein